MIEFRTDDGLLVPAVTADQMREIDRMAMEETGPNVYQMMENAGRNLASLALDLRGEKTAIVVLAGTGGNGGGGICAARHLANHAADVTLVLADPAGLSEIPGWQFAVYCHTNGKVADDVGSLRPDLIIDALIGYGLHSAPRGQFAELIRWANDSPSLIVALDVPSGIDATTGDASGEVIKAEWTLTLSLPKTGLQSKYTGSLYLGDIGIPEATFRRNNIDYASPFRARYVVPLQLT